MLKMVNRQRRNQSQHGHISDWATHFPFIWWYLILEQHSSREFKIAHWACVMPYCLLYLYKGMLRRVPLNTLTCGYLNGWFKRKSKKKQKGKGLEVILSSTEQNWSSSTVFLVGSPRCANNITQGRSQITYLSWLGSSAASGFPKVSKKQANEFK